MSDIFKALADPTRREILMMIAKQPESINTIADKFNMSRPAVSKHIKILSENKLTRIEADSVDGRQRNCYAQLEALKEVSDYLSQLEYFWKTKLDSLELFLKNKQQQERRDSSLEDNKNKS